jgi:hypothetical protein
MSNRLLFCNVGWMEKYQGITRTDKIIGGGKYVKIQGRGNEVCNFVKCQKQVFGYVQPVGNQIRIERLGADKTETSIDGIDVVITATRPGGGSVIVGWYKNATVFRELENIKKPSAVHKKNGVKCFHYSAAFSDATLLPEDKRTLAVPRRIKGGMGKSPVWFADKGIDPKWLAKVRALLNNKNSPAPKGSKRSVPDQARKLLVEKTAVELVWKHFKSQGYEIKSVEKDNLGWDLEGTSGAVTLNIEVKGLSGEALTIELTPNEYKEFNKKKLGYRLCVVTNCLDRPRLFVFRFNLPSESWVNGLSDEAESLKITERVGASVSLA